MEWLLRVMLVVLGVLVATVARVTVVEARSSYLNRMEMAPRGCKWQRVLDEMAAGSGDEDGTGAGGPATVTTVLSCKLKTIGGTDTLMRNLTAGQIERINALKLECSDILFFESSLEANQHSGAFLGSLKRLRDLKIEYCKIKYVPSMVLSTLRDLRSLSLRTHNTDWSAMNLEFHPESFRGLTELKRLDLADNNIWALPTDVFCPLFSLRHLNLTRNRLTDISQLGFSDWGNGPTAPGKACNTGLEVLDLSHNDLLSLPDNGLSSLRSLSVLMLQDNLLTALADRSFVGLGSLRVLNMSSNKLVALPPETFQSPRELRQIYLQNNSLSVLAPGLLEGLDRLEILDLSRNELTSEWINRDTFAGLKRLVVLEISHNALTKIDRHVFRELYSLQILNLEANRIESIADNAFSDLKNLVALTLSHNRLKRIEQHHFSELYVLNQLYIESNLIESMHGRALENLTNLNDLNLNDNRLTEIPEGLGKLRFLKSLDLGKNHITTVNNASFEGLEQLLGLRLVENRITNISRDAFVTLSSLHVLNLASNQIRHIDQSAFSGNPTIRAIRLDNNELEDISGVFTSLPALVFLNVSDNQIRLFDYSHFPVSLEWLDMHQNNISELGNYYDLNNLQIKMLDVSFNRLTEVDAKSVPDSIETLFLNNNLLESVAAGTFLSKRNLEKVVLYGNYIRKLEIGALALTRVAEDREVPLFYLGDNPIHCDCTMEWLQGINKLAHLRQHPRVMDLDTVMCTMEHDRGASIRPLMELNAQDFLCRYETHCFATCHCCDFDACDCKMTCPDRCSCYHDHTWKTNIVDCGAADYTEVPEHIPMDASTIYLDGNELQQLGSHQFIGKKKLEVLYLNGSNIRNVHNRTFSGIPSLRVLHLESNYIPELRGYEFDQLTNLNELYLDRNAIGFVGGQTFQNLRFLEVVNLSGNRISEFRPWVAFASARETGSLRRVSLEGNQWRCDCESLGRLQRWIREVTGEYDLNRMACADSRIVADALASCSENRLDFGGVLGGGGGGVDLSGDGEEAPPSVHRTVLMGHGLIGGGYVPLLAAVVVAIIGTALIVALACVFRQDVRLWAHARYGVRLVKDPIIVASKEDTDRLYDSYVVYSVHDNEFVGRLLGAELQLYGYSVCLHHRDVHPGAFLADSLQSAADAARKVILVVSMNFLQNEWSQPQFRVALQSVIENVRPAHRRHKIVIVLTAPIELVSLDPIMNLLIRTCTVACWGERKFWDKLRYALPDVSKDRTPKKLGDITRSPNLRYTPAPTSLDQWCKLGGAGGAVLVGNGGGDGMIVGGAPIGGPPGGPVAVPQSTPSQSTCNTEDESSSASSQHYEAPVSQHYNGSRSSASLGHVYSTIPETPQMGRNGRAYFV
ncbi:toll-like receptor Tollo [Anopheles aquasalis]|uniref:toll-like receptor Tollo n=1 Tax=Anopheles aquasalis TaxID=42839 RepID=UPI00215ADC06|nr:toll-like receptor Tollo [Anopheles aquasalis]